MQEEMTTLKTDLETEKRARQDTERELEGAKRAIQIEVGLREQMEKYVCDVRSLCDCIAFHGMLSYVRLYD